MTDTVEIDLSDDKNWERMLELAKKMPIDHTPVRYMRTFLCKVIETGEILGYQQIIPWPVVVSAWIRPGKDTIKGIKQTTEFFKSKCRGVAVTGCPIDSKFHKHMDKLGFTSSGLEVFYSKPE